DLRYSLSYTMIGRERQIQSNLPLSYPSDRCRILYGRELTYSMRAGMVGERPSNNVDPILRTATKINPPRRTNDVLFGERQRRRSIHRWESAVLASPERGRTSIRRIQQPQLIRV